MPKQQLGIGLFWLCYSPLLWARPLLSRADHLRQPCSRYRMRRTVCVPRRPAAEAG